MEHQHPATRRTGPTPDAPDGYEYVPAPADVQAIMRRRFEDDGITAIDPDTPGSLRHGVGNFWDGPRTVRDNGNGTYTYRNPYTGDEDVFSADTYGLAMATEARPLSYGEATTARTVTLPPIVLNQDFTYADELPSWVTLGYIGSPALPVFAHVASPVGERDTAYTPPEATVTGVVCGQCTGAVTVTVRHASVDHVRECAAVAAHCEWEARTEAPLTRMGIL